MPKNKPPRRSRKGRKPATKPVATVKPKRAVAQPLAVAAPGEAPTIAKAQERTVPAPKGSRRDYSYVRRDLQRMIVLAVAVLATIVVVSFFLP